MSVISVTGFPLRCDLKTVVKTLARAINGHFEALNFQSKTKNKMKTCYLRLSDKLDPVQVIEKINNCPFPKKMHIFASIPEHVPDIPLANKSKKIPLKMRRALKIPDEDPPQQVLSITHKEIMVELQAKYPGLYSLSQKNGHQLLEEIARKTFERLKQIYERGSDPCQSAFNLSKCYRRTHPHFGDFQLVLSTLHAIEDAAGSPRTQITETEFSATTANPCTIDNLPYSKVVSACQKYTDKINKRLIDHINNLDRTIIASDSEEMIAKKKVREELKKMEPYLPAIVKQVISKHFVPEKSPYHRLRVYGEPFLPGVDTMSSFLKRYQAVHPQRSTRMYNLLTFNIPPNQFASIKAMDGTLLNGAKLVIRSSDMPEYKLSKELRTEMAALFGRTPGEPTQDNPEEPQDADWTEEWSEQDIA